MIQPLNPLPWHFSDEIYITINSNNPIDGQCVCQDLYKEDAEYLILACNNFPKSIELLKECVEFINKTPNTRFKNRLSYKLAKEIDEFLRGLKQ